MKTIKDSEYKEDKVKFLNSVYDLDMSCIERQVMMKPLVDRVDQNQTVTNCRLLERMGISEMTLIEMVWTNLQLAIIGCLSFSIMEFCNDNDIQLIALHGSHGHLGAHYPPNAFLLSLCEFVLIQVFKSFSIKIISVFLNFILRRF